MNVHPKTILSMLLTGFLILGNVNRAKAEDKVLQTPTILAESHFESGLEGWTVFNDGSAPVHLSSGGLNNSGFIESYDLGQGTYWYWNAPAGFLGDKSAAYNGHLTFYLRQNYTNLQSNKDDLILVGGGITLVFNTAYNPGISWTSYDVPLQESYGWKDKATGLLASQAQMQTVLANLETLRIRGEYRSGSDIGGIDSVVLTSAGPASPTSTPIPGTTGSSFDSDPDGWTIYDDGSGPVYYPAGGVSGGYIFGSDLGTGQYWYWNAPAKFLGDKSAYYNGGLSFYLYQTNTSVQSNRTDIILVGGGITLNYDTPYNPGLTWTYYSVTLRENAGWINAATGTAPTQAQMQTVLANLQTLRIRGEYRSGPDSSGMDEVLLTAPPPTSTPTASSTPSPTATFAPSATPTPTQPTGFNYNRAAAVSYADQWAHARNEEYPLSNETGCDCNDCTNYISQVLHNGGHPLRTGTFNEYNILEWWYRDVLIPPDYSRTWGLTDWFAGYTTQYNDEFEFFTSETGLEGGDFILLDLRNNDNPNVLEPDGRPDHARVVVGYDYTSDNQNDYECNVPSQTPPPSTWDLLVNQHCPDRKHVRWDYNIDINHDGVLYIHVID